MGAPAPRSALSGLWQVPLLGVSVVAFAGALAFAARTPPKDTVLWKIVAARKELDAHQPKPAVDLLNDVLAGGKATRAQEAQVRLMLAEAVNAARNPDDRIPANEATILRQYNLAEQAGARLTADQYILRGEAAEGANRPSDAIRAYTHAIALDPAFQRKYLRRAIELQLAAGLNDEATEALPKYLATPSLNDKEKAWAEMALADLLVQQGDLAKADALLERTRVRDIDDATKGIIACRQGEIAQARGDDANAERQFRLARQLLTIRQDLDARAAYKLGAIWLAQGKPKLAEGVFNDVLLSHPGSETHVLSRLGRGWSRILQDQDDAGMADIAWATAQLTKPDVLRRDGADALAALERIEAALAAKQNYQADLEVLGDERQLLAEPNAAFWSRLSAAYEKRATQVAAAEGAPAAGDPATAVANLRIRAAQASVLQARGLTLTDNEGNGAALWHAIDLYDRAGAAEPAIALMERFARERPSDELTPECLLRLGKAHMAAGQFPEAISAFERCQARYSRSWAATQAAIPLAQALVSQGTRSYPRAEQILRGVLDDNPAITPEAVEFRQALYELARLYHREGKLEESIARFDELLKRYPTDERVGEIYFLMGDAYRKSASLIAKGDAEGVEDAKTSQHDRIVKAKALFERTVSHFREHAPVRDIEKAELRLAHFYRADAAFDLGQYDEAIKLYDSAAFRYQDDVSALAAFVQIVNANVALGKTAEAKTANERAKWLLKRMPASAFDNALGGMSRAYWEQWLKWSGEADMRAGAVSTGVSPPGAKSADAGQPLPK